MGGWGLSEESTSPGINYILNKPGTKVRWGKDRFILHGRGTGKAGMVTFGCVVFLKKNRGFWESTYSD